MLTVILDRSPKGTGYCKDLPDRKTMKTILKMGKLSSAKLEIAGLKSQVRKHIGLTMVILPP